MPVGLSARKVFWSAVHPGQLTSYTLTTHLMAPRRQPSSSPPPPHLVVDHRTNPQADQAVAEFLTAMKKVGGEGKGIVLILFNETSQNIPTYFWSLLFCLCRYLLVLVR